MSLEDFYNFNVSIERLAHTGDAYGGSTNTWAENIASYDCRIYSATGEMSITDIGKVEGKVLKCAGADADILVNDKIVSGTDEFLVKSVNKLRKKTSTIAHLEMNIEKIKD